MNMSLYVGAIGAGGCTEKLSAISSNLANVNNTGFKPEPTAFSELINCNLDDSSEVVTELQAGAGIGAQRTSTGFDVGGSAQIGSRHNYVITQTNTFFMTQDSETGGRIFTKNGHFHRGEWDEGFHLMTELDKLVLDQNQEPTKLNVLDTEKIHEEMELGYESGDGDESRGEDEDRPRVSLHTFTNLNRLASTDDDEFSADNTGMEPVLVERSSLVEEALEASGTNVARGWARLIECQRVFSYALRMVTVSDEVEGAINTLGG